jgi:Uma2 family endonuclease
MSIADRLYKAEELLYFPSDCHYELINGRLREIMSPTGGFHGSATGLFSIYAGIFVVENDLGECFAAETGFLLSRNPDTVLAPDFAFVAKEKMIGKTLEGYLPLAPDLVLETRSPSDRSAKAAAKIQEWLDAGVRMALDIHPGKRTLTVYRPGKKPRVLGSEDSFSGEDILPGFELAVSKLFR